MPVRDPLLREIEDALDRPLDGNEFEAAICAMLREQSIYPKLVPVRGGGDAGMDGAIGDPDDKRPPIPLVSTTQKNVKANLVKSLTSHASKYGVGKGIVFATSRAVSPASRRKLEEAATKLGFTLLNVYERAVIAELLYRSPRWCRDLLGITTSRPALSAYPQDHRAFFEQPVRGREKDLDWLKERVGDALLTGQPGIGKTFLLRHYATHCGGLFAVTGNIDAIDAAIRQLRPLVIIVSDAHASPGVLKGLRQLRFDSGGTWRIVADCWPGAEADIRSELGISTKESHALRPLARDTIVEVVRDAGLAGPNDLVRELVDQARGRAGLAVTLAWLALRGDVDRVGLGHVLVEQAEVTFKTLVGKEATDVLAMVAIGGSAGLPLNAVSVELGKSLAEVQRTIVQLAAGGVVEEAIDFDGRRRIIVQPEALRHALVRDRFFGRFPLPLPALLEAAESRAATHVLLGAAHRGGTVPDDLLWERLTEHGDPSLFNSYAALGESQAVRVLTEYPKTLLDVAPVGLRVAPSEYLRALLQTSLGDERPTHSTTSHPLRLIEDWVHSGRPGRDALGATDIQPGSVTNAAR